MYRGFNAALSTNFFIQNSLNYFRVSSFHLPKAIQNLCVIWSLSISFFIQNYLNYIRLGFFHLTKTIQNRGFLSISFFLELYKIVRLLSGFKHKLFHPKFLELYPGEVFSSYVGHTKKKKKKKNCASFGGHRGSR